MLRLEVDDEPVKWDTVVANLYLINPDRYRTLDGREKGLLCKHWEGLNDVWEELGSSYAAFRLDRELPAEMMDLGVVSIRADIRRFGYNRNPAIIFECKAGQFPYKLTLVISDRIFLMVSQSLHNTAAESYFEFGARENYSRDFYRLLRQAKRVFLAFCEHHDIGIEPRWYQDDLWYLKRLDLAKDVNVGAENTIRFFEAAKKLDLPGYERKTTKDNYKVDFHPVVKGGFNEFGSNRRFDLPTINFYHKSEELKGLVPREMKSVVPAGWVRLELQFYQGKNRKSMQDNVVEQIRTAVTYNTEISNDVSEQVYREFDIFSGNLSITGRVIQPYEHSLKERVRRRIYELGGICRKKDMVHELGLSGMARKSLDIIMKEMVDGGELIRKGHSYKYSIERMNELGRRYKGDGQA